MGAFAISCAGSWAYNVALASLPNFTMPGDLSPSARYWARDVVTPEWTMDGEGAVRVPLDRAGIGVTVDEGRVELDAPVARDLPQILDLDAVSLALETGLETYATDIDPAALEALDDLVARQGVFDRRWRRSPSGSKRSTCRAVPSRSRSRVAPRRCPSSGE